MALRQRVIGQIGDDRQGGIAPRFGRSLIHPFPPIRSMDGKPCRLCRPRDPRHAHPNNPLPWCRKELSTESSRDSSRVLASATSENVDQLRWLPMSGCIGARLLTLLASTFRKVERSGRGSTLAGVRRGTLALAGAARGSLALLVSNPRNDLDPWGTSQGCLLRCAHRRSSRRPDASRPCRPAGQAQFMLPGDLRRPKRPTPVPRSLICRISVFGPGMRNSLAPSSRRQASVGDASGSGRQ